MKLSRNISKDELKKMFKEKRESLSESSLNTYGALIRTLVKRLGDIDVNNTDLIIKYLNNPEGRVSLNAKKTIMSGLFILTGKQAYKDAMMNNIKEYNDISKTQTKTQKEEENWLDFSEIKKKYDQNKKKYWEMLKQEKLSKSEKADIQKFLIFIVSSGVLFPPRRSQDWAEMKWEKDKSNSNYIEKGKFVFQQYKTDKTYHKQTIEIPREAVKFLKAWKRHQDSEYIFTGDKGQKLSSNTLGQKLNSFFDNKHISTSMLRKIYLTEKYRDVPKLLELQETAREMGHSVKTAMTNYVKKEDSKDEMEKKEEKT